MAALCPPNNQHIEEGFIPLQIEATGDVKRYRVGEPGVQTQKFLILQYEAEGKKRAADAIECRGVVKDELQGAEVPAPATKHVPATTSKLVVG